jgi:hypothetical protein
MIRKFLIALLTNEKSFVPRPNPNPIIGPMSGEINIAPIITAVELVFNPREAIKIAPTNTQRFTPVRTAPFFIFSVVMAIFSASLGSLTLCRKYLINLPSRESFKPIAAF